MMGIFNKNDDTDSQIHDLAESPSTSSTDYSGYESDFEREKADYPTQPQGNQSYDMDDIVNIENDQDLSPEDKQQIYAQIVSKGVTEEASIEQLIVLAISKYKLTRIRAEMPGASQEQSNPTDSLIIKEFLSASRYVFNNNDLKLEQKQQMMILLSDHSVEQAQTPVYKMMMLIVQDMAGENIELDKEYNKIIKDNPELAPEMEVFKEYVSQKKSKVITQLQQRNRNRQRSKSWAPTMSMN